MGGISGDFRPFLSTEPFTWKSIRIAEVYMSASMSKKHWDTAGEFWSGGEGGEARSAGRGAWRRPEPVPETTEVDSGRRRDVLQVDLGQPTITRPAQPEGAHALRDGALDPGPSGIEASSLRGRQPPARHSERLVLRLWRQPQMPWLVPLTGTHGPHGTGAAVGLTEGDANIGATGPLHPLAPAYGQLALRASGLPAAP